LRTAVFVIAVIAVGNEVTPRVEHTAAVLCGLVRAVGR
jgi:hypothetical protein